MVFGVGISSTVLVDTSNLLFLRKLEIVPPEDPAIPPLGIHPKDAPKYNKDTCSTIFIAASFIIARSWKQHRCPSTEEWIQKLWYIYTMVHYSPYKNNGMGRLVSRKRGREWGFFGRDYQERG